MTADEAVRLYTVAELAELWKVSKTFLYAEIKAQRLPVIRLGRGDRDKTRVRATDALTWIERRQSGADTRTSRRTA